MDREDFNQYLNGEFKVEEVKYLVYRVRNKIFFIDPAHGADVSTRIDRCNRRLMGTTSILMYVASYAVNLTTHDMIKNRFPDQPWPKQIMEEVFSGVGNDIEL